MELWWSPVVTWQKKPARKHIHKATVRTAGRRAVSQMGLDVRPKASKAADLLTEHQSNWSNTCKPIKDHLEKISSIVGFDVKPDVSMLLQKHIWFVCDGGEPNKLESGVNWVTPQGSFSRTKHTVCVHPHLKSFFKAIIKLLVSFSHPKKQFCDHSQ